MEEDRTLEPGARQKIGDEKLYLNRRRESCSTQCVIREMRTDGTLRYYSVGCGAHNSRLRAISTAVLTASSRLSV